MSWCWRWRYLRNGLGTCETSKRWINIWMSEAAQRRPLIRRGRYFAVPRMGRLGPSFWTSHTLGFTQAMTGTRGQLGALARGPARRAHDSPAALDEGPLTANGTGTPRSLRTPVTEANTRDVSSTNAQVHLLLASACRTLYARAPAEVWAEQSRSRPKLPESFNSLTILF